MGHIAKRQKLAEIIGTQLNECASNYHPQTKFAKVMFSQVSVCPRGGMCGKHAPRHTCPPGMHAPGHAHPLGACMPPGMHTSQARTPQPGTTRCAKQAGGTHPTGMHSCLMIKLIILIYVENRG